MHGFHWGRRSSLQEHMLTIRILKVNADLSNAPKIISTVNVSDNCWGTSVGLKELVDKDADDDDIRRLERSRYRLAA